MTQRILIAGGGITGLTAAYQMQKRAAAAGVDPEIILVEKDDKLGGKTQTQHVEGMVIEEGPDSFIASKPWMKDLCAELGIPVTGTNPKCHTTYIYHHGRMESLPVGMQLMIPTQILPFVTTRLLSPAGKLRAAMEPLIPVKRTDEDESIGSFVSRRFGREVLENIAGPLMGGIYGGDYEGVSLKATFPMFMKMENEKGSLLIAAQKQKLLNRNKPKGPTGFSMFLTVPTGLNTVVDTLEQRSDRVQFRLRTGVELLTRIADGKYRVRLTTGEELEADAVVLSLAAYVAAGLIGETAPDAAELLNSVPYGSSVVVALGYNRADIDHPLDASGFLVPARESLEITASTWVSSKWSHAAPPDKALLRVFMGRAGERDWTRETDEVLLETAMGGLKQTMGLAASPIISRVFRWPRAMAQYRVGHLAKMDRVDRAMAQAPGLYLAGAAFRGVGLPDCVREGTAAAEKVARHLGWDK